METDLLFVARDIEPLEERLLPSASGSYAVYSTHSLLSLDVEVSHRETGTSFSFGDLLVEITDHGQIAAIECALPQHMWPTEVHLSGRLAKAEPAKVTLYTRDLEKLIQLRAVRFDKSYGVVVDAPRPNNQLIRVASTVVLELNDERDVVGIWMEGITVVPRE